MQNPKISVVMPVYNCEKYVDEAIESVLNQTFKDFELIIINDGSTDNTLEKIKKYEKTDERIRIINNEKNLRIATSLNNAIDIARADIIARMDGDDISLPTRFEKQYKLMQSDENLGVVGCNMITIDKDGKDIGMRRYSTNPEFLKKSVFRYSPFAHPATMLRKKAFIEAGKYFPRFVPAEDLDLWIRIGRTHKFSNVDEFLFKYRVLNSSSSHKKLVKLELKVILLRMVAVAYYGYTPTFTDVLYNIAQLFTSIIMPSKLRYKLFNFLRDHELI